MSHIGFVFALAFFLLATISLYMYYSYRNSIILKAALASIDEDKKEFYLQHYSVDKTKHFALIKEIAEINDNKANEFFRIYLNNKGKLDWLF